ncbi:MAG: DNA gyrase subunit A, partial [Ktedonobacterales bacterium]
MELGIVKPVDIVEQMRGAYLDYSMSVIVARALPDVRDGLKPVHRRVLYAMDQMGLQANRSFRKSAGVVGEVLKEYHPNGDASVYDTLVRLTQSWNMRYPLALGQGNWGCFTGDTKIKLVDGTEKCLVELAQLPEDEMFHVYSVDTNGQIVIGEGRHARLTRRDAELVEVTLDSGAKIRCTPNHPFMTRDGTYKDAQYLEAGDSLMPGYFDTTPVKPGLNPYLRVMQPATGEYEFVHHLADDFNARRGLAAVFPGPFVRHHQNFNRFDNRPSNIMRMEFLARLHLHADHMADMWKNQDFRNRQRAGVQRYYDRHPEMREYQRQRLIHRNQNPAFRLANGPRVAARLRTHYATHSDKRDRVSEQMRALWQDSDYRERMSLALRGVEKRPLTGEQRRDVARIISEKSRAMWGEEAKRAEIVAAIVRAMSSPLVRTRLSAHSRAAWRNPVYRAKFHPQHFSRMAKVLWEDPNTRESHSAKIAEQWQDEGFRWAQRVGVQGGNQRRLEENPLLMRELAGKAAVVLRDKWHDGGLHQRQVMRQKVVGYAASLLAEGTAEHLTPQAYDERRTGNW